jgi:hypothetical protein
MLKSHFCSGVVKSIPSHKIDVTFHVATAVIHAALSNEVILPLDSSLLRTFIWYHRDHFSIIFYLKWIHYTINRKLYNKKTSKIEKFYKSSGGD